MTRDEIISMAREAGFMDMDSLSAKVTDMFYHGFPRTERIHLCSDDRIEHFTALVAAAEREECAALCDRFQARDVGMQPAECAAAIRAMNKQEQNK